MREIDKRSKHLFFVDHFITSHNFSLDDVWSILRRYLRMDALGP